MDDALATLASFQGHVQHADGKVSTLVAFHAGAAATVASQASAGAGLARPVAVVAAVLLGLFLLGFLVSGYHMLRALRPVLRTSAVRSRYSVIGFTGFTGFTGGGRRAPYAERPVPPVLTGLGTRISRAITGPVPHTSPTQAVVAEDVQARITEARATTRVLAEIAERKYRHVSRAVPWAGLMLAAAICWLTLVTVWQ
ncbi:hypothetical protein AB0395_31700 [Streptosporangium sp. NPDC051023]|uniref:hypothetical protein n=1 Tax=Streptosporangium sp. NPDC051023 TaxID=3155410 RepID=UPI00344DE1B1